MFLWLKGQGHDSQDRFKKLTKMENYEPVIKRDAAGFKTFQGLLRLFI
jgi:hypothetical protein